MVSGSLKLFLLVVCLIVNTNSQILDLTHVLSPKTPRFPHNYVSPFTVEFLEADSDKGFWLAQNNYKFNDLIGTSVVPPYRFDPNGRTVDEIPFDDFFAQAIVIDVRDKVATNGGTYRVKAQDIKRWISINGDFPDKTVVIFNTGWDEGRWPDQKAYFGSDNDADELVFPALSVGAARYLLKYEASQQIRIVGMGIDTPLLGFAPEDDEIVNAIVAEADKYVITNLRDVKRLPPVGASIVTMPLKIFNGTASPARVYAELPSPN